MSTAATATKKNEKLNGESSPPKPPSSSSLVLSSADFEAAAQMCEHEWMSHASGMSEVGKAAGVERRGREGGQGNAEKNRFDADGETVATASSPPKPPVVAAAAPSSTLDPVAAGAAAPCGANGAAPTAPRAARQQQFAEQIGATPIDGRASSPLPSTPSSASDDDDEGLDLVPEQRGASFRGRRGGTTSSRLPLTSPAISDGGGLRDEHVEDPWSDDDESEDDGRGGRGDAARGTGGAGTDSNGGLGGTPIAALRRRSRKLGGGRGGGSVVRRALLPPPPSASSPGRETKRLEKKEREKKERDRSLRSPGRHFTVVTTASLPWMTGTSVNPTLRSAYLARALPRSSVTLLLPWLPASQQPSVFPKGVRFETPAQQEAHVREWIRQRTGFDPPGLRIAWYHARYCPVMKSIFPFGGEKERHFFFSLFVSRVSFLSFLLSFRFEGGFFSFVPSLFPPLSLSHLFFSSSSFFFPSFLLLLLLLPLLSPSPSSSFSLDTHKKNKTKNDETDLTRLVGGGEDGRASSSSSITSSSPPSSFDRRDVAILEEPEHLTWFHSGPRWTRAFVRAIGVAHTNYGDYVSALRGRAAGAAVAAANRALVAVHCDAVIRLSDALPALPRARTAFVHGVARGFISAGRDAAPGRGAYFVGKALWAKGYSELVALLRPDPVGWRDAARAAREAGSRLAEEWGPADAGAEDLPPEEGGGRGAAPPSVDAFGSGEDADPVRAAAAASGAPLTLRPGRDHLDPSLRSYRVFVNPSTTDVVATTSAEALALGRWLVCPIHPCNEFFSAFGACLRYGDAAGFRLQLCRALSRPPPRLSAEERASLTWAAATRRFLDAVEAPAERQRAQNARRRGIFLSASTASLAGGSSAAGGSSDGDDDESDDEERRFPPTALRNPSEIAAAAAPPPQSKLSRLNTAARAAAAAAAESAMYRLYGFVMRVEASRRLFGAGAFTRVAPALPCGSVDHALERRRPCHERAHELQGYRRSRYVGGRG